MSVSQCDCSFPDTPFLTDVCGGGLFMVLTQMLLLRQCDMADACRRPQDEATTKRNEYDFIVVGAGVAGPIMASRLSENPDWNVLLVEAGPQEPTITEIPAYSMSATGTVLDWKYVTENSSRACLSSGGRCYWPRGKMVSGSSGMQGMMYTRPHPSVLDEWNKTNPGWSFQDCLPYYKKSENNLNPDQVDTDYHGFDGPMTVQNFPTIPAMCDVVLQAGEQMGYERGDLCGSNQTRVGIAQMMVFEGLRMSTSRAYIRPYLDVRNNMEILINSQVTRILIDQETKTATGVEYVDTSGNTHTVYASKEVIISAGAVNSPQLLLLSGIGPREDLEQVGIDVIVDLPGVGYNLQNHLSASIGYFMDGEDDTNTFTYDAIEEFVNNRTGYLANTGLSSATIFMTSKYVTDGIPDLQVFFSGYQGRCSRTGSVDECTSNTRIGNCGKRRLGAVPTNVRTLSRGYLKLNSSNPLEHPLIYPRYLENERDIEVLIDGLRLCIELANTPALQKYNLTIDTTKSYGCQNYDFGTDEYFECVIRLQTGTQNHQGGSCKMGPADDPMAVLDNNLKIYGVNNMRVVDASFFPFNPNSNPTSVIIMAAEKISDVIKQVWNTS